MTINLKVLTNLTYSAPFTPCGVKFTKIWNFLKQLATLEKLLQRLRVLTKPAKSYVLAEHR